MRNKYIKQRNCVSEAYKNSQSKIQQKCTQFNFHIPSEIPKVITLSI